MIDLGQIQAHATLPQAFFVFAGGFFSAFAGDESGFSAGRQAPCPLNI